MWDVNEEVDLLDFLPWNANENYFQWDSSKTNLTMAIIDISIVDKFIVQFVR